MARKTSTVQEPTAEYWAQVNEEARQRLAEYDAWAAGQPVPVCAHGRSKHTVCPDCPPPSGLQDDPPGAWFYTTRPAAPTFEEVRESAAAAGLLTARLVGPRTAMIPDDQIAGLEHTVWVQDAGSWAVCSCEDGGAHCWHAQRALELYTAARPRPALYWEAPEDAPALTEVA